MGNCKDCKWWNAQADDEYSEGFGVCNRILGLSGSDGNSIARAYSCGCCGGAEFQTKPDFGCIQFEARDVRPAA